MFVKSIFIINLMVSLSLIGCGSPPDLKGKPGSNGARGDDGDVGPAGKDGGKGERGEKGEDGTNGVDGQDGSDGLQGPQGEQGPQGQDGQRGADGSLVSAFIYVNLYETYVMPPATSMLTIPLNSYQNLELQQNAVSKTSNVQLNQFFVKLTTPGTYLITARVVLDTDQDVGLYLRKPDSTSGMGLSSIENITVSNAGETERGSIFIQKMFSTSVYGDEYAIAISNESADADANVTIKLSSYLNAIRISD